MSQTNLRLALTRGLVSAGACVIMLAVGAAIWGGLSGFNPAPIFGHAPPGLEGAAMTAVHCVIFGGLPVALVGFVLGGVVALLIRES